MNSFVWARRAVASVACVLVGCDPAPQVDVDLEVNGASGDALTEAFFGFASLQGEFVSIPEDFDGDGNLDLDEDLDNDFNLDVAEDLNGNGVLDIGEDADKDGNLDLDEDLDGDGNLDINEDLNENGILDDFIFDLNEDGQIDDQDVLQRASLFVVATSGEVDCESFTDLVQSGIPLIEGTSLTFEVNEFVVGADRASNLVAGQTITAVDDSVRVVEILAEFGQVENGVPVDDSFASGSDELTLSILAFDEALSLSLDGVMDGDLGASFPIRAELTRMENCPPLSALLQASLE